ncbi:MAG TPA: DUF488 domain-containing protein [Gammaproteobacteria bacterium]|nr:DUF488 domain-containing protein [Gammaproteobacteria bacterium]
MPVRLKRVYEEPAKADGERILVDRVWPRGLSKDEAAVDRWLKEVAPSKELRQWFGHEPERWDGFRERYFRELDENPDAVGELVEAAGRGTVTLVFGAKDTRNNNAVALREYLRQRHGLG